MRHAKTCALGDVSVFSLIQRDDLPMVSSCVKALMSQDPSLRKASCLASVKRDGAFSVLSLEQSAF